MAAAAAPAVRRERRAERFGPGNTPAGRRRALTVAPAPRRVSGPSRRQAPPRRRPRQQAGAERGLVLAAASAVAQLPLLWPSRLPLSHSRVARKVGPTVLARIWIGLVAFALIGIVTLQLGLLKLNAGIGRALEHEAVLQRENAALSIENSEMASSSRITSWAARQGMEPVPMESLRFLDARPGIDVTRAAAALSASAHAAAVGSGEAPLAAAPAASNSASSAPAEQSAAGTATSAGEASSASSVSTAGESSAAASAPASSSGESSARAAEAPATQPAESTQAAQTPAAGAPAPSGSAEGAPGGGTRASPAG